MQKLQINLRNGQTLVVANNAPDNKAVPLFANKAVPLFARFLDALRMSAPTHTDVFVFDDPVLLVRLSEVSAASVLFQQEGASEAEPMPEVKRRSSRKTSNKSIT